MGERNRQKKGEGGANEEGWKKSRHFYPLVVNFGLAQLQELDIEEIRAHLDELYE